MDKFLGTRFLFKEISTGKEYSVFTNNMTVWVVPELKEVEDLDEFGDPVRVKLDMTIPFERFIQLFAPVESVGAEFIKYCLEKIVTTYEEKIQTIIAYCQEHCDREF